MWDLPGPGLEPMSPALAGGFLTTAPPGKPYNQLIFEKGQFHRGSNSLSTNHLGTTFSHGNDEVGLLHHTINIK